MENFVKDSVNSFYSDFQVKCEVYNVLQDTICDIEVWNSENNMMRISRTLDLSETLNKKLVDKIYQLESKNKSISSELQQIKIKAGEVREHFVIGVDRLLTESKQLKKAQDKRTVLTDSICQTDDVMISAEEIHNYLGDLPVISDESPSQTTPETQPIDDNTQANTNKANIEDTDEPEPVLEVRKYPILFDFNNDQILECFTFLEEHDIFEVSFSCKHLFYRVDVAFGMGSTLIQPGWENEVPVIYVAPPPAPTEAPVEPIVIPVPAPLPAVVAAPPPIAPAVAAPVAPSEHGFKMTREIVVELSKKLSPNELRVVLGLGEQLKKQTELVETLIPEKEDLTARLQNTESVRDFLIDKLKTAEMAIKSTMNDNSVLKKQSAADHEIISYLDLHVQDLETEKQETNTRCNHLQHSLDLQFESHSRKEQQLMLDLHDLKTNYEQLDFKYKNEKKILVKEVKSLRQQVDTLTHERNLHANQFALLREAFNTTVQPVHAGGAGGGSGKSIGSNSSSRR